MTYRSRLEAVLKSGKFAVTAELGPPRGADARKVKEKAAGLKTVVDAVNVTDNSAAVVRMAGWAACAILVQEGLEPVFQMVCRDRNRIALQSDLLGAGALGIRNVLCLSGDHPVCGDHPGARAVYDIDSIQQLQMTRHVCESGKLLCGRSVSVPPDMFVGAVANPFASPVEWRVPRLTKKIRAGAEFIQTQCVFDPVGFRDWLCRVRDMGLTEKAFVLAGVVPLESAAMGEYMTSRIPGVDIPDEVMRRMKSVKKSAQAAEGIKMACELIEQFKEMPGVSGIHLMTIGREYKVAEIVERSGIMPETFL